jgi:tetratricopeptide (TPR) repeat protein
MTPIAADPPDEMTTVLNGIPAAEIRAQLELILRSRAFIQSHRIRRFLQFVVEESLLGQPHRLKEYLIGLEVFDRREAFDPRVDSIVRVEARRLRYKLEEYYRTEGREDGVRIVLRKGSYVPIFEHRTAGSASLPLAPRRTIEISPLALMNASAESGPLADEVQRRLAHVFIKEGCFQVTTKSEAHAESEDNGNCQAAHAVDYTVGGSIEFHPEDFHLILQVQQSMDGSYVWSEATDGQQEDLSCVDRLAQALLRDLNAPPNEVLVARRQAVPIESRDFYLQGRYFWKLATPDSIRDSVEYFTKAIESDDSYAAAWAALAEAILVSSMFGLIPPGEGGSRMKQAALKATSLNVLLPEAHVALGSIFSLLDWDWSAGSEELQKAIQLDSHEPVGHIAYGIQLACCGMLDSAVAEVERALELDPASLFPNFVLGWLYGVCRRFDEAISQHLLVSRLATDYGLPHLGLGLAYAGKGQFADAMAHLTNASQMKCRSLLHGQMGYCYAMSGRREEALREIGSLTQRSQTQYVSPLSFAAIYAGLGDTEQAFIYLERGVEVHDTSLPVHLLSTEFDGLRNMPRFQALRQRIGLPQSDTAQIGN